MMIVMMTILRFSYYGEFLPNTYYAKVGGAAWTRGFGYFLRFGSDHLLYAIAMISIPYLLWSRRKEGIHFYLFPMICHLLYVLYVGGDFKPTGRFLLTLSSFFCVLTTYMMVRIYSFQKWLCFGLLLLPLYSSVQLWSKSQHWAQIRNQNFIARRAAGLFLQKYTHPTHHDDGDRHGALVENANRNAPLGGTPPVKRAMLMAGAWCN